MMQDARQEGRMGPGRNGTGVSTSYAADGVIGNSDYGSGNSVSAPNQGGPSVRCVDVCGRESR